MPAGQQLFAEGDHGEHMFGIVSGQIDLLHGGAVVASLGPNETFGEMALIDDSPRSLTAVASTDAEVVMIDRRTFVFLVHETPMFALEVMRSLADRLRPASQPGTPAA